MPKARSTDPFAHCADPARARHYWEMLRPVLPGHARPRLGPEAMRILGALFSGSEAMSELLVAHPEWLAAALDPESLKSARTDPGLRREVAAWLEPAIAARDFAGALSRLRSFRQREQLRIAARDLARLGSAPDLTRELSNVADVTLDAALQITLRQLTERLGSPWHLDAGERWQPTKFCVLGLGKLGGQELNYSSDVDLLLVYSEEGAVFKTPPRRGDSAGRALTSHAFFKRVAEQFIAEITRLAPEGTLYRIDLRLRPEGGAGPLVRSLESYENYYAQWGQTWERLMLIKTRCVAGDATLAGEFLEMIQPFRYPRSLNERVLGEIAAMKRRIEDEVVRAGELERNVKLGRGGIREIEFIAQTLQLLNAGRLPFLQGAQTLPALQNLVRYELLAEQDAQFLSAAYCFLREVEHRLQMERNLQTHTIPTERRARERLAALMGFGSLAEFESARRRHCDEVRRIYDQFVKFAESPEADSLPRDFQESAPAWKALLAAKSFQDPDSAVRLLAEFVNGPGYVHVSQRTSDLARQLAPRFFAICPEAAHRATPGRLSSPVLSDPDRVLARLDSFITAYGSRAMLYESWAHHPAAFELLLWLFDRSEFLAELAIRTPDLVDDLEQSGRLRRAKAAAETLADLRHGRADADQHLWLRRYHQAEFMRIGLRDILGLADLEQSLAELSALAQACLHYALEVALRKLKIKNAPLAIIGLGKLGGAELTYGSDLDILFVADDRVKNLPHLQQVAAEVLDLLNRQTEMGRVFQTDARLRPDGEKGLLVNTLSAHDTYYRERAQLWELQALSRARFVAGDEALGRAFGKLAGWLTDFRVGNAAKAKCVQPGWQRKIVRMRERIEQERTPAGKDPLAFKTGVGGLIDAEFIAQSLCLAHGWHEPNTLLALRRAARDGVLPATTAPALIDNYRELRRLEGILRRWSYEGEAVLPDDPAAQLRVAIRCGFHNAPAFFQELHAWRSALRRAFEEVVST